MEAARILAGLPLLGLWRSVVVNDHWIYTAAVREIEQFIFGDIKPVTPPLPSNSISPIKK
jgi:hypothetical protein